jgi:hypothetical protein
MDHSIFALLFSFLKRSNSALHRSRLRKSYNDARLHFLLSRRTGAFSNGFLKLISPFFFQHKHT